MASGLAKSKRDRPRCTIRATIQRQHRDEDEWERRAATKSRFATGGQEVAAAASKDRGTGDRNGIRARVCDVLDYICVSSIPVYGP